MTLITSQFQALAQAEVKAFGMPTLPVVVVSHPIGTVSDDVVARKADAALDQFMSAIVAAPRLPA